MMDLTTYNGLKQSVADYLGREDLEDQIPGFIRMAEARMNRELRLRVMERRAVTPVGAGVKGITLPCLREDGNWNVFLEMRDIVFKTADGRISNLVYQPIDDYQNEGRSVGWPYGYTITANTLFFMPAPDAPGNVEMAYYAEVPPLSDVQQCNAILHVAPDLYLYGSLMESVPYTRGSAPAEEWKQYYQTAVSKLQQNETRARFTSTLRMKPIRRI